MSRVARIVVPGFPRHVTQRGNRRADVFETDRDREAYLRFLKQYPDRRDLSVWAYCLMTNHIHLVVVPQREGSLGQALRDAHTVYAMYFNSRTQLSGHVWQGRVNTSRSIICEGQALTPSADTKLTVMWKENDDD